MPKADTNRGQSPSEVQEPARQGWYCFKAHSTWSTTTSSANTGITTADILKAADWSSESVFTNLGRVLMERLSSAAVVTQTATVDM